MKDAASQLRSATRRAKSDVANKLVSMFLHDLSRRLAQKWSVKVDSLEYENAVRAQFDNRCPYCSRDLSEKVAVVEHLDGMNRYRAGLHVPGNVLIACKDCNGEKRRDDSAKRLSLGTFGWESFLSHDGSRCPEACATCGYWAKIWPDPIDRRSRLLTNVEKIRKFRHDFPDFEKMLPFLMNTLPDLLTKLYADCQQFAANEIRSLLDKFDEISADNPRKS